MISTLAVANYRSLRGLTLSLGRLNVVTGPNGSGKSNLYRALGLLAATAQGRIIPTLAAEGGLPSTLWAGPPRRGTPARNPVSLRLGFAAEHFSYAIDIGFPQHAPDTPSKFLLDPVIKRECIWHGPVFRPSALLLDRNGPRVHLHTAARERDEIETDLATYDSVLTLSPDPRKAPESWLLREAIRAWRFYDHIRTDPGSPVRFPHIGTRTPVLASDGADLAAAIQTIREVGDSESLDESIHLAFPGSRIEVDTSSGRFELRLHQPGLLRPLSAAELSEGTLRFLLWAAALYTPRPPSLMVLNEPETSLHPDLVPPLARLIIHASRHTQIIVVTHAAPLAAALQAHPGAISLSLERIEGETRLAGATLLSAPPWHWPSR